MCIGKKRKSQVGKRESGVQKERTRNMGGSKKQHRLLYLRDPYVCWVDTALITGCFCLLRLELGKYKFCSVVMMLIIKLS